MSNNMKTTVKILLFCVAFSLTGCSAERRIQRIVRNHPELIEVKIRTLDTLLTVQGYTDKALVPMSALKNGETYCEATDHGTFIVRRVDNTDSIRIDFIADTQQIRYQDTLKYRQVVISNPETKKNSGINFWNRITEWISFLAIGAGLAIYFLLKFLRTHKTKNT